MGAKQWRADNLCRLVSGYRTRWAFSARAGISEAYAYQILTGRRGLGERAARKIEERLGLDSDWLDLPHGPSLKPGAVETAAEFPEPRDAAVIDEFPEPDGAEMEAEFPEPQQPAPAPELRAEVIFPAGMPEETKRQLLAGLPAFFVQSPENA